MARTIKYRIGTSGWSYKHWKKAFYPDDQAAYAAKNALYLQSLLK